MAKSGFGYKIRGNKETIRMFDRMPDKVQRKVVRKAATKAATVVRTALRAEVRAVAKDTGALAKSVASKVGTSRNKKSIFAVIGADNKERVGGRKGSRYLHLVNNGFIAVDGRFVPGKHFMERVQQRTESEVMDAFGEKLGNEIAIEAAKLGYKGR